jgi:putative Holliday junction resolvase
MRLGDAGLLLHLPAVICVAKSRDTGHGSINDAQAEDFWPHRAARARVRSDEREFVTLLSLPALRAALARDQRLIGIDPGSKTIGLALSDVGLTLASPYGSLKRGKLKSNAAEIVAIARKENAGGLVVGLPLSMDGTLGPAAQGARDWAAALADASGLPVAMFDERLSSAAANRFLIETADVSRKKRAEAVDRMAAAWLLQAALDASRADPLL